MSKKIKPTKPPAVDTQQVNDLKDQLARSLADYSNLEKRMESQRQLYVTLATVGIITKMIDVLDDLNLAQKHLQDSGLKMTINKFFNVLKSEGLEEINTDSVFDPSTMECISTAEGEENKIISVEKKGYMLNGQCIRPAQVIVSKKSENNKDSTLSEDNPGDSSPPSN